MLYPRKTSIAPANRRTFNLFREAIHVELLKDLQKKRATRRTFVAGALAAGTAGVLVGCSNDQPITTPTPITPAAPIGDADILNFALNLEYLEASYYLYAATGQGIPAAMLTGTGTQGTVTAVNAGAVPNLTPLQQQILNEIAYDELSHVKFLRAALTTANAVAVPNINISASTFGAAAAAAMVTNGSAFNPYTSFANFLLGAFIFEDVGVTAYSGAAPLLASSANLNYAAGIQAVEAYHAAYVRTALTALGEATPALITIANQIATLRGNLGGGFETLLTGGTTNATTGVVSYPATGTSIVAADTKNAIAFARSTDQVLHIVYGTANGAGVTGGLFFPQGLNGRISKTAS